MLSLMLILAIETSCDETAAAVVKKDGSDVTVLSNVVSSQIELHRQFGGVVPEVAAREHVKAILPVIETALAEAGLEKETAPSQLKAIAVATGPGLVTSLIVGVETAKTLAHAWGLPLVAVNHIEGHIYANFIGQAAFKLPALVLTVSGGHTNLVLFRGHGALEIVGQTRDDAAGEAFDKAAQLMDLGYPGGPVISKLASEAEGPGGIELPRPMLDRPGFDFSFSGLKTALLYQLQKDPAWRERVPAYAAEFQQAVIDVLIGKTLKAARHYQAKTVLLAGGVSANARLRQDLAQATAQAGLAFHLPDLAYTTDNAAMIGAAACFKAERSDFTEVADLKAQPNQSL